ncbi:hypothetical protein C2699_000183 [Escherichia coli]|nr:hypothetical protein [Escherichia coli]
MTVTHNGKQYTAKKLNDNEWQLTSVSNAQKRPEMASDATLRDYFAAKAMQAMISNPSIIDNDSDGAVNYAASAAYKFADAMLKARE